MQGHQHRAMRAIALTISAAVTLSGCVANIPEPVPTTASEDAIVIEHAYGTLELDSPPERVVTLGLLETDVSVDLGITPIAIAKFFATPDGVAPWLAPELDEVPEIIDTTTTGANGAELDVESIAALNPDVIIATTYSQLGQYYDQLSAIAPVLGPSEANYLQLPWRDQTRAIATALGLSDEAEARIDLVEKQLTTAAAENSVTDGHDYTLSLGTPDQIKVMNDPADASVEVMNAFGMTFSRAAAALPGLGDGSGSAGVSEENIAALDADIVMIGYFGSDTRTFWEASTLFQELSAVKNGGYIAMDLSDSTALRNPSPLSIPYVIQSVIVDQIVPALQG
ncbi:ABC transporter substrate-binding protein [Microbacterium nymphoidis]|uniref:ABC transporter substrate-binding protein n=1 Tax=Microbacterium nymphoidis TaxID=2898586 RepID=UPI001E5584D2|nr:ABC transporter substrate-binding protein [Microbacterium nymphoidis]MCD2498490.1 ABC transporter substrate-binding protein [Microbacterium nymphoidis]